MTTNNGKVSVIIRAKNEERWVGHCIQSVLEHIDTPEIILINNHSTDKTIEITRSFQKDPDIESTGFYTDIKILNIDNYSPGSALNLGIKECSHQNVLIISIIHIEYLHKNYYNFWHFFIFAFDSF